MNAYDTTCFSHFLDTLIHLKPTIIDDHHVFLEEDAEKIWFELSFVVEVEKKYLK